MYENHSVQVSHYTEKEITYFASTFIVDGVSQRYSSFNISYVITNCVSVTIGV